MYYHHINSRLDSINRLGSALAFHSSKQFIQKERIYISNGSLCTIVVVAVVVVHTPRTYYINNKWYNNNVLYIYQKNVCKIGASEFS